MTIAANARTSANLNPRLSGSRAIFPPHGNDRIAMADFSRVKQERCVNYFKRARVRSPHSSPSVRSPHSSPSVRSPHSSPSAGKLLKMEWANEHDHRLDYNYGDGVCRHHCTAKDLMPNLQLIRLQLIEARVWGAYVRTVMEAGPLPDRIEDAAVHLCRRCREGRPAHVHWGAWFSKRTWERGAW